MNTKTWMAAAAAAVTIGLGGAAMAQGPAPGGPPAQPQGERPANVVAIPGVVADGAKWRLVLGALNNMDGIVGTADGGVIFAQEQNSTIRKVDAAGKESVYLTDTHGGGAISVDARGRLFMVQRTCTDPGLHLGDKCQEPTMVGQLQPVRKTLTKGFADGKTLGRVNDIVADGNGGAFFTSGGAWHVGADGKVSVVADTDIRTNGIMLSRDGRTLYVTNNTEVDAFDVAGDGTTSNRRVFAQLAGGGGDGMALDDGGRLYVSGAAGVHVIGSDGKVLGVIPTPRRAITIAFSGPGKRTLYLVGNGAIGPDGKEWTTPEGTRNTAMTLYKIDVLAPGIQNRPK